MGLREILLATCAACSASTAPPHSVENRATHAHGTLEAAREAATGHGQRRDYRKAAAIAGDLCEGGCGDFAACRFYFRLVRHLRGVRELDADAIATVTMRLCARGLDIACTTATNVVQPGGLVDPLFTHCLAGDDLACDEAIDASDADRAKPSTPRSMTTFAQICASGDADACVPEHRVPPQALCDAGDEEACHTVGRISDQDHAARVSAIAAAYAAHPARASCP